MTVYYAAVKWPADATNGQKLHALATDLPIVVAQLIEEGVPAWDVIDVLERAMDEAEGQV